MRSEDRRRTLDIKNIEGTEEDIPADLIVSAIGQAVDFTGWRVQQRQGRHQQRQELPGAGQPGFFVGGDVVRPHLLTTAIGHGAIAADGIDRFLQSEALEKRPKIDVHTFDLKRKMIEKGWPSAKCTSRSAAPTRARRRFTTSTTARTAT
jgi:hypothetical protein